MSAPSFHSWAIAILNIGRPIQRNSHTNIVPLKKISPGVVDQNAVRLHAVHHGARREVFSLGIQQRLKALSSKHQWLATVPDKSRAQLLFSKVGREYRVQLFGVVN